MWSSFFNNPLPCIKLIIFGNECNKCIYTCESALYYKHSMPHTCFGHSFGHPQVHYKGYISNVFETIHKCKTRSFNNICFKIIKCIILILIILIKNQRHALISQIYYWNRTLHVSNSVSVHHQESSTVLTAIHTGYADCFLSSRQHYLYDLYLLVCVQC